MIAADTNVVLRYVLADDRAQHAAAASFMRSRTSASPAFISLIVICELTWVLRQRYGYPRRQIHELIRTLLETAELVVEDEEAVSALLSRDPSAQFDLADALIAYCANRAGCSRTMTFDRNAANAVPGMELLT